MFKVYLIEIVKKNIEIVSQLFKRATNLEITKTLKELEELKKIFQGKTPALVLIGPSYSIEDIETILESIDSNLDYIKIVLLVRNNSVLLLKKAIELNIYDILEFPFDAEAINQTISRANKFFSSITIDDHYLSKEYTKVKKIESKKIMVFSIKGGTGKSFLAVNLAIDLFNKSRKSVVLADLNYYSGDVSIMLNLYPKNTIYEIISVINQLDDKTLDNFLSNHTSGIKVLPSPKFPTQAEAISTELALKVVDLLLRNYDYLVIDTGPYFSETMLLLLEKIDYLCLISSMDVPNIKNLKLSLQVLKNLKFPMDKIFIIINRANSKVGMSVNEIEDTIGRKIDIKIPSSIIVPITINKGIPIVIDQPRSPVSRSINELTKLILK